MSSASTNEPRDAAEPRDTAEPATRPSAGEPSQRRPRAGRARTRAIVLAGAALVSIAGVVWLVHLGQQNRRSFHLVCDGEAITAAQGRGFPPWGHSALTGDAWRPIPAVASLPCTSRTLPTRAALAQRFAALLVARVDAWVIGRADGTGREQLADAQAQLDQARLLLAETGAATRSSASGISSGPASGISDDPTSGISSGPTSGISDDPASGISTPGISESLAAGVAAEPGDTLVEADASVIERLQADLDYWRARDEVDAALATLERAAAQLDQAVAREPRHNRAHASAWQRLLARVREDLASGPGAAAGAVRPSEPLPGAGAPDPGNAQSAPGSGQDGLAPAPAPGANADPALPVPGTPASPPQQPAPAPRPRGGQLI